MSPVVIKSSFVAFKSWPIAVESSPIMVKSSGGQIIRWSNYRHLGVVFLERPDAHHQPHVPGAGRMEVKMLHAQQKLTSLSHNLPILQRSETVV